MLVRFQSRAVDKKGDRLEAIAFFCFQPLNPDRHRKPRSCRAGYLAIVVVPVPNAESSHFEACRVPGGMAALLATA